MYSRIKNSLLTLVMVLFANVSYADDLDILNDERLVGSNILFVMDLSGSMRWCPGSYIAGETCATGPSRLDILKGAFQDIVADTDFDEINIGLSFFSGGAQSAIGSGEAHGIAYPVSPMIGTDAQTLLSKTGFVHPGVTPSNSYMPAAGTSNTREYLSLFSADANLFDAYGSTPIVDALFEAGLYFRGEDVEAGKFPASDIRAAHPATFIGAGFASTTTTTSNAACAASERTSCTQGFCGATESCTTTPNTTTSVTDTGGCTLNTNVTVGCGYGNPSCGLGTGCTNIVHVFDKFCGSNNTTIASCTAAHPTWYACATYEDTDTVTNSEGFPTTTVTTKVRCKEDNTYYWCDGADNYSCPTTYESCTKCPDDETTTTITGSTTYKSPIIEECSKNGIILLSDGGPTSNASADLIRNKIGTYAQGCENAPSPGTDTQVYGRCGPELAKYLATEDHADGSTSVPNLDGIQSVKTYTVGLSLIDGSEEATYLKDLATNGDGAFVNANDRASLTQAFKDALLGISESQARSFSSPSYSIDKSTLLNNGSYVYIPSFDRLPPVWPGNLKKFKLVNGVLTDADNNPALDAHTGLLATARDLWSADPATDAIKSGGAANKINPAARISGKMKTDVGGTLVPLSNAANDDFGTGTTDAEKADYIKYISGTNPSDDTPRNHMGDIVHSKPIQLEYSGGKKLIFVGSNEGFLHAINDSNNEADTTNGTEAFAYMPKELLKNIKTQYLSISTPGHTYGVDGLITVWIDESSNTTLSQKGNQIVDVASGEKAYVAFGLRRGGKSYTVIDVTNSDSPVLKWSKPFGNGDSWSQPVVTQLKYKPNATEKPVVVFGGGFNDDASGIETAGGNYVYIADLETGDIVWDTSVAFNNSKVTNFTGAATALAASNELPNAVPARIRVIDIDRDNSIDRLYFGDTGGNIWRADLNAANFDADTSNDNDLTKATLRRFAALGGTGADNRKFFEELDIAIYKNGGRLVTSIAIGSGDRPNPLSITTEDKFFVLYDTEVLSLPTEALVTLASGNIKTVPVSKSDANAVSYKGWQKPLNIALGEKVLSSALTFQGKILFTSFLNRVPSTAAVDSCVPNNTNENKVYVIDIFAGSEDAVFTHTGGEILSTPKIVFPPGGACVEGNCSRTPKIGFGRAIVDFPSPLAANGDPILDSDGNPVSGGRNTLERVYWIDSED